MTEDNKRDTRWEPPQIMPVAVYMMANWKRALSQQANQFILKDKLDRLEMAELRELARAYLAVHECDTTTRTEYGLRTTAAVPGWVTLNAP